MRADQLGWTAGNDGYKEKNRRLTELRIVHNRYNIPSHYRIAFLESLDRIACGAAGLLNLAILLE